MATTRESDPFLFLPKTRFKLFAIVNLVLFVVLNIRTYRCGTVKVLK